MTEEESISTSEAAKLLFVSRLHVAKLVADGKLTEQQDGTLRMSDVLAYRARKQAEAKAFFKTQTEDKYEETTKVDVYRAAARRWRRRVVRRGEFLSAQAFCQHRHVSPAELRRLMHQGDVFTVEIARRQYYPAVLASVHGVQLSRLNRICRQLAPLPGWFSYDALVSPRGSLGGISVMQSLTRGKRYRRARWYAGATVAHNRGD